MKCAYPEKIEEDLIRLLPMVQYQGKVLIIDKAEGIEDIIAEIKKEAILGFDTETRPSFKKGKQYKVSLLQLAGKDCAWLFRLDYLKEHLSEIYSILADPNIIKAGVAVKGDISQLHQLLDFTAGGFCEVSDFSRNMGILNTGLKKLCGLFMGVRISKSVQMSNWASETLNDRQVTYAATDAWISRELYLALKKASDSGLYEKQTEYPPVKIAFISRLKNFFGSFSKSTKKAIKPKPKKNNFQKNKYNKNKKS
ncbi:MAG: 3'-5' exonuclease [Opitutales bacterium]